MDDTAVSSEPGSEIGTGDLIAQMRLDVEERRGERDTGHFSTSSVSTRVANRSQCGKLHMHSKPDRHWRRRCRRSRVRRRVASAWSASRTGAATATATAATRRSRRRRLRSMPRCRPRPRSRALSRHRSLSPRSHCVRRPDCCLATAADQWRADRPARRRRGATRPTRVWRARPTHANGSGVARVRVRVRVLAPKPRQRLKVPHLVSLMTTMRRWPRVRVSARASWRPADRVR